MEQTVVFDVRDQAFPLWLTGIGVGFTFLFSVLLIVSHLVSQKTARLAPRLLVRLYIGCLCLAILWTAFATVSTGRKLERLRAIRGRGADQVVEGLVRTIEQQGGGEMVRVEGVEFKIHDRSGKPGYDQTTKSGGVLRLGARVRIYYLEGIILRVELLP
jgi:hypothetical protein